MYTHLVGIHSDLTLSQADPRPMYLQIFEQIRQRIAAGDWPPGQEIPSIRQLAVALTVSVITVKRAYLELERSGLIVTQQGRGSTVAALPALLPEATQLPGEAELAAHLDGAARFGSRLGLGSEELVRRLRRAIADFHSGLDEEEK